MMPVFSRRSLLKATASAVVLPALKARALETQKKPKLRLAVKYGMIKTKGSVEEKLNLVKKLGFEGVEVDSPSGLNKAEVKAASDQTGIQIHGVIDSVHWRDTLSHSDEAVRAKGLAALSGAIEDAAFYGSDNLHRDCLEQLPDKTRATDLVCGRPRKPVGGRILRLQQHDQVWRSVRRVDS
jgi:L-ribulose-5-phosphate 3-epimerase